jgi:hypothetical protein
MMGMQAGSMGTGVEVASPRLQTTRRAEQMERATCAASRRSPAPAAAAAAAAACAAAAEEAATIARSPTPKIHAVVVGEHARHAAPQRLKNFDLSRYHAVGDRRCRARSLPGQLVADPRRR